MSETTKLCAAAAAAHRPSTGESKLSVSSWIAGSESEAVGLVYQDMLERFPIRERWTGHVVYVSLIPREFVERAYKIGGGHEQQD